MMQDYKISETIRRILSDIESHYSHPEYKEYLESIVEDLSRELQRASVSEEFAIALQKYNFTRGYCKIFGFGEQSIALYGGDSGRTISWSDDDQQPENEWLYVVSFPTGAYFFGDSYPKEHFNAMFEELKSLGAKYSDTANKSLYFDSSNAKDVHQRIPEIVKKYRESLKEFETKREIESLEKRLQMLKTQSK